MNNTEKIFSEISSSNLFRLDGKKVDLNGKIKGLCAALKQEEQTDWDLGEGGDFLLSDFVIGAFWAYTECHGGQYAESYEILSILGDIFSPGMSMPPEKDGPEFFVYETLCKELIK